MEVDYRTYLRHYPDRNGRFGPYGGAYLTEELVPAFEEIADAYQTICHSSQFISELRRIRVMSQISSVIYFHGCFLLYVNDIFLFLLSVKGIPAL